MREVKEKITAESEEPSKPSNPRRRQRSAAAQMLPFSSSGRSCARLHRMGSRRIVTRAARSRIPPTMPCRKSTIWQKRQLTGCRKQNPNRSGKPGQNLFPNTNVRSPSILLRQRGNIHRKANHKEISLFVNRLLRQATSSPKCESIHRPLMHLCSSPGIQLRKFMKSRRSFPVHR